MRPLIADWGRRFPPLMLPRTGKNTRAMANEAVRQMITVVGKKLMNSPTTPGQNNRGMNTASVVAVDAMMGQAMRLAASPHADFTFWPSERFLSASSDTTMAPSTSMPATSMRLNRTTILRVKPIPQITRIPVRNAPGMVSPTKSAERGPMAAMIRTITSTMAVSTLLSRSLRMSRTSPDWSMM